MYGGSTTSILVNVPGEAGSVVTLLDGYQMTRRGRAGAALAIAAVGSFVAGTVGVVGIMLAAAWLAELAVRFGPRPQNRSSGRDTSVTPSVRNVGVRTRRSHKRLFPHADPLWH